MRFLASLRAEVPPAIFRCATSSFPASQLHLPFLSALTSDGWGAPRYVREAGYAGNLAWAQEILSIQKDPNPQQLEALRRTVAVGYIMGAMNAGNAQAMKEAYQTFSSIPLYGNNLHTEFSACLHQAGSVAAVEAAYELCENLIYTGRYPLEDVGISDHEALGPREVRSPVFSLIRSSVSDVRSSYSCPVGLPTHAQQKSSSPRSAEACVGPRARRHPPSPP